MIALTARPVDLRAIRAPVLALLTRAGDFTDRAITPRFLNELADCRTVTMEARHWIPTEQPGAMREAIELWCRAL